MQSIAPVTDSHRDYANDLLVRQMEASPDGILIVGANRRIVLYNRKFVELWNLPRVVVEAGSDERAVAAVLDRLTDPKAFLANLDWLFAHPTESTHSEIDLVDGRVFERHTGPLPIRVGDAPGRIFFFRDITARRTAERRVAEMARHDELTGLDNRGAFVARVEQTIARARRGAKGFAVLYLDLDHFKDVNDTLGHLAGDLLLQGVARRLKACVRETDLVARFGGDEFAILVSDLDDPAQAIPVVERLTAALREPFSIHGNEVRTGASTGIAVYGGDATDAESLLSHADVALYRVKSDERGAHRFFTDAMDAEVRHRVALGAELRDAIDTGQLFVVYQPQVAIATGRIVGLEALVRWRHPKRGIVSPAEFIPVAETSGLIVGLGEKVMREACRQTTAWITAGIAPSTIAVNVSGLQFKTPVQLENMVRSILAETTLPARRLELELTESVLMDAWFKRTDVLVRLRQMGLRISIDDFGTGFSSLDYLSRFPVDRIKIAQDFIRDLTTRTANAAIVRATIGLARELHTEVIAEGVETLEQLELLKSWGCLEVQGYYYSKPVSAEEVTALLRRGTIAR